MTEIKKYTKAQQRANRKKWVKALRSGEFEQGRGWLRSEGKYCCLGVLCEIMGADEKVTGDRTYFDGQPGVAPKSIMATVGLRTETGEFELTRALTDINDDGTSFEEIAKLIESEPEGLFE